eukprot:TRINITY_DN124049_c0_g1_i1.p1 TRINITY_DN124049_c0_g1~~TRINITY_DN124049_c0_g1_i1.p1  ORF type:complete len:397 (-),score=77.23 TRINITY_DN124049_c0_g1_i1:111-1301(-)
MTWQRQVWPLAALLLALQSPRNACLRTGSYVKAVIIDESYDEENAEVSRLGGSAFDSGDWDFGFLKSAVAKEVFDKRWSSTVQNFLSYLETAAEDASSFLNSSVLEGSPGTSDHPVLFVLQSGAKYYDTRLAWIQETWGSDLNHDSLVAIGDKAAGPNNKMNIQVTKCPDSHGEGGCCKMAEVIITAYNMMKKNPSLQWMYYSDDDAYVRPDAVQQVLAKEDHSGGNGKGVVYGVLGCTTKKCGNGICGGGGFAASRAAVTSLVESDGAANFLRKMMQTCSVCEEWSDVSVAQLIQQHSIKLSSLAGLYGWRLDKAHFDDSLKTKDSGPLMYHYIQSQGQMEFLQAIFHGSADKYPFLRQGPATNGTCKDCASYKSQTVCLKDQAKAAGAVPWEVK